MDISKQAISSVFIHFWNITFSIFFAKTVFEKSKSEFGVGENSDECAFYFLCFLFDTILGVFLVWMLLKIIYRISIYFRIDSIKVQGFYGNPILINWYIQQLLIYLLIVIISKIMISIIMFSVAIPLQIFGNYIFRSLRLRPKTELIVVMIACPCVLSIVQYWLLDNFLSDVSDGGIGPRTRDYEFLGKKKNEK